MKVFEQMTNLEFKEYCEKQYKPFFDALKEINCFISKKIINKSIRIQTLSKSQNIQLIFDNIELPPNLIIKIKKKQNFIIKNYPKSRLPENFKVEGSLKIEDSPKLHYFGKNTYVVSLQAKESSLKNFKNIIVKKDLDLSNAKMIKKLPDDLILEGNLDICSSSIKKLGKNTKIKGNLIAFDSHLEKLPDNLFVLNDLFLNNSSFVGLLDDIPSNPTNIKMGKNIYIGGLFYLMGAKIKKLGKNLFAKSLDITFSNLENLPSDLQVIDYCNISHTKIKKLPPLFLKRVSTIIINDLFENIDQYYSKKLFRKFKCFDEKITYNYIITKEAKEIISLPIYYSNNNPIDQDEQQNVEIYIKNALLYNSTPIQKKLLLERFDTITQNEIKKFINIKPQIKSVNYQLISKYTKNIIKNKVPLIFYCRSKQAIEFLYQNGYHFNEKELNLINEDCYSLKNLYESFLIKYNLNKEKGQVLVEQSKTSTLKIHTKNYVI